MELAWARIPIGREIRLKIETVWIQIPPRLLTTNTHMDEFTLLEAKIESLKKEIEDNPDYSQNIKDSILDDIAYYENHLNHLNDTL